MKISPLRCKMWNTSNKGRPGVLTPKQIGLSLLFWKDWTQEQHSLLLKALNTQEQNSQKKKGVKEK